MTLQVTDETMQFMQMAVNRQLSSMNFNFGILIGIITGVIGNLFVSSLFQYLDYGKWVMLVISSIILVLTIILLYRTFVRRTVRMILTMILYYLSLPDITKKEYQNWRDLEKIIDEVMSQQHRKKRKE